VSDLVAYNPEKREDGLRAGTLRELFRDEIRKSWQEYVEQVGAAVAESTPHFQDALNDILAGGRRIF
jgi:capsid protein